MSRWVEEFISHVFQSTWSALKKSLSEAVIDDETIITSVEELARLKKVVRYVDELLLSIDPELVPSATWDKFHGQADQCNQQINNFNNNRNIAHIQSANSHADNLLTYVRPYMAPEGKSAEIYQNSMKEYANTVNKYADEFKNKAQSIIDNLKNSKFESEALLKSIIEGKDKVDKLNIKLFEGEDDGVGIETKIDDLVAEFGDKYEKLDELYNHALVGDEEEDSIKKAIILAKESAEDNKLEIDNYVEEVSQTINDINRFNVKIFGELDKEGNYVGGLANEFEDLKNNLTQFEILQNKKYNALNEQIEELLPGATSAGLASAYREMKASFDNPIRIMSGVFYLSIGLLIFISSLLIVESIGGGQWISFVPLGDWDTVFKSLLYKIPFYAPVLWLAYYATKRRSEYQRLQQEYAHKEALAKSYRNYKIQIDELGDEDKLMQKEFIVKAIDAIAYNASKTLDGKHGDKMPSQDLVEKVVTEVMKRNLG